MSEEVAASRQSWTVQVSVEELKSAVALKVRHHTERMVHYVARVEETTATIKAEGISLDDVIDDPWSASNSYRREIASIDPVLLKTLMDVQTKRKTHEGKVTEFQRWERMLSRMQDSDRLQLKLSDIEFFGL